MVTGPDGAQVLHSRQCFITHGISSRTLLGTPAAFKMVSIDLTPACHHLRCSLRSSLITTALVPLLRARKDALTSNLVQSFACGVPTLASRTTRRSGGTSDGPRRPGNLDDAEGSPEDELGAELDGTSSPAPKSVPSGSCACASDAGRRLGAWAGGRGCAPFLTLLESSQSDGNLHSPGKYVCAWCPSAFLFLHPRHGHMIGSMYGYLHSPNLRE